MISNICVGEWTSTCRYIYICVCDVNADEEIMFLYLFTDKEKWNEKDIFCFEKKTILIDNW